MQAIILAGGKGTRLRPLTLHLPKPVVPFINRPLLMYQLDLLASVGIKKTTLSLSYQPDKIRAVMEGLVHGMSLEYVVEDEPLGTGGAVRWAAREEAGTAIVFNGDVLNDLDLKAALEEHHSRKAGVTIVLTEVEDPTNFGLVKTDRDGRVEKFLEKPGWEEIDSLRTINAGTYIIEPEYLSGMCRGTHCSIEREFFPALVEKGAPFYAYIHRGYWIDIGTTAKYLQAHGDFFRRRLEPPAGYTAAAPNLWLGAGARVSPSVHVRGPSVVGPGSTVDDGVILDRFNVIGAGCRLGRGAHLEGTILWDGVAVGPGSRLRSSIIGQDARIGEQTRLNGLFVLGSGGYLPDFSSHTEMDGDFEGKG